jgi:hypothetical protein
MKVMALEGNDDLAIVFPTVNPDKAVIIETGVRQS